MSHFLDFLDDLKKNDNNPNNEVLLEQQASVALETYKLQNKYLSDTIELRKEYANRIYKITKYYLLTIGLIVIASASCKFLGKEILSQSVLITILGTTTINILGLMIILATPLFPKSDYNLKLK